ncbi:NAD-dependent epimerase/dehydratase family protein [Pseudolysinimonas sp.]|uniref:NAD-dependent epimerase/dehydratase family protein n=1 Tax=Pseudolysinimonas sp. TaxID=2680009 RepID=UPI003F7E9522
MSRVLITGGAGRLGQSVVRHFAARGDDVVSVDARRADGLPAVQETVDLRDIDAARALVTAHAPDAVIHLAAIAVPFSAPEDRILTTNVSLAYNVLASAAEAGVPRIITASSPTVMGYGNPAGWMPERLPLDELEPARPWNAYALSKLFAESIARMLATAYGERSRFASFRPCYVIAPEEWAGAPTQQGHTVRERLADPDLSAPALFNYVDARDVASFLALLLERMDEVPNGETFFVGASDALAREPLAELLPRYLRGVGELARDLVGTAPAFSIAKAQTMLGWSPQHDWRSELREPAPSATPLEIP